MRARVIVLLGAGLIVVGCSSPSEEIASRLRAANSPLVREVDHRPANFLDPAQIDVWLSPGVTDAQANELWCEVIEPAGGTHIEGDTGVAVWNNSGTKMMAVDTEC